MRILITNDDGINAPGLDVLHDIATALAGPGGEVWTVAPAFEQSGVGHCISYTKPMMVAELGPRKFAAEGSPADCVLAGLYDVMQGLAPDLILSGINRGANLGDDVTYSGTVSAALEGALAGIRSIALSQVYSREGAGNDVSFDAAEGWGERVLRPLVDTPFAERTLINVNFPATSSQEVKGIRVVRQGFHDYARGSIVESVDPRGFAYYWVGLHAIEHTSGHDTDLEAVADGFISVTPLQLDLTHHQSLASLSQNYRQ